MKHFLKFSLAFDKSKFKNSEVQPNKAINLKNKKKIKKKIKKKKSQMKPPIRSIFLATKQNQDLRYK